MATETKKSGPGKSEREGITLMDAVQRFGTEQAAEDWFMAQRWPNGIECAHCGSSEITRRENRIPMPFYCRTCKKYFSVRTGTLLHASKLPLAKWAMAFFLFSTNLKGVSSMKLHRDLGITQKSAWHLAHRIRESWDTMADKFAGPVEVDETYIGGKERNKHACKKLHAGRGAVGKAAVAGVKDRETNRVDAISIAKTNKETLQQFIVERVKAGAQVYTDEAAAYRGMPYAHKSVRHSVGEYVNDMAHTNGIESFWSLLKRGYVGTYHQMSVKHLNRYVREFAGRHNLRPLNTVDQMAAMLAGAMGKRLSYAVLIAN